MTARYRRRTWHLIVILCVVMGSSPPPSMAQAAADEPVHVTHGPMLGHVTSHSVRVWCRTSRPSSFDVAVGTSPEALSPKVQSRRTRWDDDCTGWVIVQGLSPYTLYHYQVLVGGKPSGPAGTFRTLPDAASHRHPDYNPRGLFNFRFQYGSCANQNPAHGIGPSLPTYDTLLRDVKDDIHFAIMNGDWLYEELREYPPGRWMREQGVGEGLVPRVVRTMPTVVGVWENYKLYLSRAANLSAWHRQVPSLFTFDDHELVNDIWGAGSVGYRNRRAVFRDIGTQAWYDYLAWANPVAFRQDIHFGRGQFAKDSDILTDPEADFTRLILGEMSNLHVHWGLPTDGVNDMKYDDLSQGVPNSKVYGVVQVLDKHRIRITPRAVADGVAAYSIGRRSYFRKRVSNCEFYFLDTRSHRQMHDVRQRDKPGLTILGTQQRRWLLDGMKNSDADFFFVVSSVPFTIPHIGAGGFEFDEQNKDESWTVFLDEREKLIRAWDGLGKPVFVLTGDLHNSFAIRITDRVWEMCSGPHNSVNHVPKLDEGDRPATGRFKFGPREVDIRWSSYILPDLPRLQRLYPFYCVVQVNNVFNMPKSLDGPDRWVAYPHPQVIFQYFEGRTGRFLYAESISTSRKRPARN